MQRKAIVAVGSVAYPIAPNCLCQGRDPGLAVINAPEHAHTGPIDGEVGWARWLAARKPATDFGGSLALSMANLFQKASGRSRMKT